jgi:hypothetical protein
MFVNPSSLAMLMIPEAHALQERWYTIALCFFFNTDSGADQFLTTDSLSQNNAVGPVNGTPIIRNL